MNLEKLDMDSFSGMVIAVPDDAELLLWVMKNCPSHVTEADFFRFLCMVGRQFMVQSMDRLHTDAGGVLDFVEHPGMAMSH